MQTRIFIFFIAMFILEGLPKFVLLEVFSFVIPSELLELRFLNKDLFNIVQSVIYNHLCYSTYSAPHYESSIRKIQDEFIKKNGLHMRQLIINNGNPFYRSNINENSEYIFGLNSVFKDQFPNLISLDITIWERNLDLDYLAKLNYFKPLLFNMRKIVLSIDQKVNIKSILSFFNPNKLKYLKITQWSGSITNINDIMDFSQFKMLEYLEFCTNQLEMDPPFFPGTDVIIFPSLKKLKIRLYYGSRGCNLEKFGNLNHIELIDLTLPVYKIEDLDYFKKFTNPKVCLNHTASPGTCDYDFALTKLKHISEIPSITTILIGLKYNSKDVEDCFEHCNEAVPLFLYIEEITFDGCNLNIQYVFNLLKYFPNIKKVNYKGGELYNHNNLHLYLPNNLESFLFCLKNTNYQYYVNSGILSLLNNVNTYIY